MSRFALISTNSFVPWAGSEELWYQTALRFAQNGHAVGANVPRFENEAPQIVRLENIPGVSVHRRACRWVLWRRIKKKLAPRYNPDVAGWLVSFRPDLVIISQGGTTDGLAWMEACRNRGVPYVVIVHLATDTFWPDPSVVPYLRVHYEAAAAVCFVSEDNRQVAAKHFGLSLELAIIVRNPFLVSYDVEVPWPKSPDGGLRLACVGRLGAEHKGQDLLFDVLREPKWKARPLTVTLVGSGHHREALERLQRLWDVPNIRFGGQTSDIGEVWANHHAMIMPSRYEGLPLSLVEAMLCRRVSIVTDVGGNRELVEDGVNGFLAAAPTKHAMDEALERAWARRGEWEEMGRRAGEAVRAHVPRDPVGAFATGIDALLETTRRP